MIITDYNQIKVFIYYPGVQGDRTYLEYGHMAKKISATKMKAIEEIEWRLDYDLVHMARYAQDRDFTMARYYQGKCTGYIEAIAMIMGESQMCEYTEAMGMEYMRDLYASRGF